MGDIIMSSNTDLFQIIQNKPNINKIIYTPRFSAICSIGQASFHGTIEIEYCPGESLLEFESFERWLRDDIAKRHLTIEDLARLIFDNLLAALGDIRLCVIIHAETTVHAPVSAIIRN